MEASYAIDTAPLILCTSFSTLKRGRDRNSSCFIGDVNMAWGGGKPLAEVILIKRGFKLTLAGSPTPAADVSVTLEVCPQGLVIFITFI